MEKEKLRLFIAINIGDNVRDKIKPKLKEISALSQKIRVVKPESIHLTIKFLGNVDSVIVPKIMQAIDSAVSDAGTFYLEVKGIGAFPNSRKARVIWAGLTDENQDSLQTLYKAIEDNMTKTGFEKEERQFNPHLTLARIKFPEKSSGIKEYIEENSGYDFGTIDVNSVKLIKSTLLPGGAEYECIREFLLE